MSDLPDSPPQGDSLPKQTQTLLDAALHDAAASSRDRAAEIERLLAAGANPRATKDIASPYAGVEALKTLGVTPLMMAAKQGNIAAVRVLLPVSDPLAKTSTGGTALMRAAACGSVDVVLALLPVSDANAQDKDGATALYVAATLGHTQALKAILPHADARVRSKHGTPLSAAVSQARTECALALVHVSDLTVQNSLGCTPFLMAVTMQSTELIAALAPLSDVSAVDTFGKSAADILAKDRRAQDIEAFAPWALDEQVEQISKAIRRSQLRGSCGSTPLLDERARAIAERRALAKTVAKASQAGGRRAKPTAAETSEQAPLAPARRGPRSL
jgi:hypothetical protein